MITLDQKHKKDVEAAKTAIKGLTVIEDFVMGALATKLNIEEGTEEYDSLWDHVFNDTDWTVKYSKKVK